MAASLRPEKISGMYQRNSSPRSLARGGGVQGLGRVPGDKKWLMKSFFHGLQYALKIVTGDPARGVF